MNLENTEGSRKILEKSETDLFFGNKPIAKSDEVYTGRNVVVVICRNSLIEGHLQLIPKRIVAKFIEQTENETIDMFQICKKISKCLELIYNKTIRIVIEDGIVAGQEAKHTSIHLIPNDGCAQNIRSVHHFNWSDQNKADFVNKVKMHLLEIDKC